MHIGYAQGSLIDWAAVKIDWNQYGASTDSAEVVFGQFVNSL